MKVPDPEREVEKIMKIVDLNNSGVIDYMGLNVFYFLMTFLIKNLLWLLSIGKRFSRKKIL